MSPSILTFGCEPSAMVEREKLSLCSSDGVRYLGGGRYPHGVFFWGGGPHGVIRGRNRVLGGARRWREQQGQEGVTATEQGLA